MFFYKDTQDGVHALSDATNETLLPKGCIQISEADAEALTQDAKPKLDDQQKILMQIIALEQTVTQRRLREAALGTDEGWLSRLDSQIALLREKLPR